MAAVCGLIDIGEVTHLWKVKRGDLSVWVITFAATLALGIERGILVGVGASLLLVVLRTVRPHLAVLGRLPGTEIFRNVERFPEAETVPGVLVVRPDAQLHFGNADFFRESLARFEQEQREPLRALVIDASGLNQVDGDDHAG